jgi:thioredoxin-like negative regulator of GroEL
MAPVTLTDDTAREILAAEGVVIVSFWAPWCGVCRSFEPVFEQAAERHTDLVFARANTAEQPELRTAFGVDSVPMVAVVRDRGLAYSRSGALSAEQLEQIIAQVREQTSSLRPG